LNAGLKSALSIGLLSFFLAVLMALISQKLLDIITSLVLAFLLLLVIIAIGVLFDVIGVAVTVASEKPLNARAAKKIPGAREALNLVKNAGKVASFCNDVVGDISGTLSGAVGAAIIYQLFAVNANPYASIVMTAGIAALIIGGKAWGKNFALKEADQIVFWAGRLLAVVGSFKDPISGIREHRR